MRTIIKWYTSNHTKIDKAQTNLWECKIWTAHNQNTCIAATECSGCWGIFGLRLDDRDYIFSDTFALMILLDHSLRLLLQSHIYPEMFLKITTGMSPNYTYLMKICKLETLALDSGCSYFKVSQFNSYILLGKQLCLKSCCRRKTLIT